jgi:hypothetical protein
MSGGVAGLAEIPPLALATSPPDAAKVGSLRPEALTAAAPGARAS